MESVTGGILTCDDPTSVPIAYCVIVPGDPVKIWNWRTTKWENMPDTNNPLSDHLLAIEPVFQTGLAAALRCDIIPDVEPTIDHQIVLLYRMPGGVAAEYAGHLIPKKYPDAFTIEFKAKS